MRIHGYFALNYYVLVVFAGLNHILVSAELNFIIGCGRLLSLFHKKRGRIEDWVSLLPNRSCQFKYEAHCWLICVCPDFVWSIFIFKRLSCIPATCAERKKEFSGISRGVDKGFLHVFMWGKRDVQILYFVE